MSLQERQPLQRSVVAKNIRHCVESFMPGCRHREVNASGVVMEEVPAVSYPIITVFKLEPHNKNVGRRPPAGLIGMSPALVVQGGLLQLLT